jgi:hypothetical protein
MFFLFGLIPMCIGLAIYLIGARDPMCTGEAAKTWFLLCMKWSYPVMTIALGFIPLCVTIIYIRFLQSIWHKNTP